MNSLRQACLGAGDRWGCWLWILSLFLVGLGARLWLMQRVRQAAAVLGPMGGGSRSLPSLLRRQAVTREPVLSPQRAPNLLHAHLRAGFYFLVLFSLLTLWLLGLHPPGSVRWWRMRAERIVTYLRNPVVRSILPACARLPLEVRPDPKAAQQRQANSSKAFAHSRQPVAGLPCEGARRRVQAGGPGREPDRLVGLQSAA